MASLQGCAKKLDQASILPGTLTDTSFMLSGGVSYEFSFPIPS